MRTLLQAVGGAIVALSGLASADVSFSTDLSDYNDNYLGMIPNQTFKSSDVVAPIWQVNTFDKSSISDEEFFFIAATFNNVSVPMIFSSTDLSLVWSGPNFTEAVWAKPQTLNGETVLTFYGDGLDYIYSENYTQLYTVAPVGFDGAEADLHEMQITSNGTAVITVYPEVEMDLTALNGSANGTIEDAVFQEIDIATGDLVFSWQASDWFNASDTYVTLDEQTTDGVFDWAHINSVWKYGDNYLVSFRYLCTVILVDGSSGKPLWHLGGKRNDFDDISSGAANFTWQHMPRLRNSTELTLFDNAEMGTETCTSGHTCSRGMLMELDFDAMTVKSQHHWEHPQKVVAGAMGSVQDLSNGNTLVAWGTQPSIVEYSSNGTAVMDIQRGAVGDNTDGWYNIIYRAWKGNWQGNPSSNPSIATEDGYIYVSWNGAYVNTWVVLLSNSTDNLNGSKKVDTHLKRDGFETKIKVSGSGTYARVTGLDKKGNIMGSSGAINLKTGAVQDLDYAVQDVGNFAESSTGNATSTASSTATGTAAASATSTDDESNARGMPHLSGEVLLLTLVSGLLSLF